MRKPRHLSRFNLDAIDRCRRNGYRYLALFEPDEPKHMKATIAFLIFTLFAAVCVSAEDAVLFRNGDIIKGTILAQDAESISFSSPRLGTVRLMRADIEEIRAAEPQPDASGQPGRPAAPPPTEPASPPPADTTVREIDRWSGQAGLALAMRENSDSNQSGTYRTEKFSTYRVYGNINWKGDRNNLAWDWTYRYSEDETRKRDDYLNITQRYKRDFLECCYAEARTVYQQDYNRSIDNEFLQTAEIGRKWFDTSRLKFSTSVGGGYHQYQRSTAADADRISEPKLIFDESLEWKLINTLTLFQKYTHLGDLERYHLVFSTGLENKLIMELFLRMEYRLDRDTDTSYDDKGYYDKALLASLLYKF